MSVIYKPTGMAREYSPYALNIYIGCSHRCKYCYAPGTLQRKADAYFGTPAPRKNILSLAEADLQKTDYREQILLSFVGDVYCDNADNGATTRAMLQLLNTYHAPVAVLSKGGKKMLRDIDVFKAFGDRIAVGTTLTFIDEQKSADWEPFASRAVDRLETLKTLHDAGVKTFASFEPTIEPSESIQLIERTLKDDSVDHYKIGKINHYRDADKW
ncbi:MAG: hypothetical protein K2O94_08320, partial [Clostridiales bacterium]|nr:hypothetical protein [Clostridiales bacterium]